MSTNWTHKILILLNMRQFKSIVCMPGKGKVANRRKSIRNVQKAICKQRRMLRLPSQQTKILTERPLTQSDHLPLIYATFFRSPPQLGSLPTFFQNCLRSSNTWSAHSLISGNTILVATQVNSPTSSLPS